MKPNEILFQRLINEAPYIPGDDGELVEGSQIPWLNPKLVKEGQEFVRRNSFVINLAHTAALLMGFSFKNMTTLLLRTGKFNGVENSMERYVETEQHILEWYESDIMTQADAGFKDIQRVRRLHAAALKSALVTPATLFKNENIKNVEKKEELINAMKKDLACFETPEAPLHLLTYEPKVLMSQFDMAMTQYGFFGLVYLFPEILGIKDTNGMEGFVHLWAVLGRMIGIQDRFNLALHGDYEFCVDIFNKIGMASLMRTDMTAVVLQESLSLAVSNLIGFTSLKSSIYYALNGAKKLNPEFTGENIYKTMDWSDIFYLNLLTRTLFLIFHFDFIRTGINQLHMVMVRRNKKRVLGAKGKNWKFANRKGKV